MFSKVDASSLASEYNRGIVSRIMRMLEAAARAGFVGGVYTYTTEPAAFITKVSNFLTSDGWTVVVDTTAQTITIS